MNKDIANSNILFSFFIDYGINNIRCVISSIYPITDIMNAIGNTNSVKIESNILIIGYKIVLLTLYNCFQNIDSIKYNNNSCNVRMVIRMMIWLLMRII